MTAVAPAVTAPGCIAVELELKHSQLEQLVQTLKAAAEASRPSAATEQQGPPQRLQAATSSTVEAATASTPSVPPPSAAPRRQEETAAPPLSQGPSSRQGEWQVTGTTDAMDHDGAPITDIAFTPALKGLPGGDGHGGWLISVSDCMVNLWELSGARRASGDPILMLMHSQTKDAAPAECLGLDPTMQRVLMATRSSGASRQPLITSHSLSLESGFLAEQPAYLLQPLRPAGAAPFQRASQVVSLHSWGGPLTATCAAAFDGSILVFPLTRTGARPVQPKAEWRAHASGITTLHRSRFGIRLFSGSSDGKTHMWDMTGKPSAPMQSFGHGAAVTKVLHVRENLLAIGGVDGSITLWDPRRPAEPIRTVTVGTGHITAMAASAPGDSLLAGTADGIFHVNLSHGRGEAERLQTPRDWVTTSLEHNSRTGGFYASSAAGTITCFSRLL